jgi:hypothetical protein
VRVVPCETVLDFDMLLDPFPFIPNASMETPSDLISDDMDPIP